MMRLPQYEGIALKPDTLFPVTPERDGPARPERPDPAGRDPGGRDPAAADTASDEALADAFGAVARKLREKSAETLAPWDVTPAHLRALRVLNRHGAMRPSALSDHLQVAPRTATEVVDALETRGLVRRRADPGDRRAILVEVTEHGAGVLAEVRAARGTEAGRVFGRLTPADRADLARLLSKLRD